MTGLAFLIPVALGLGLVGLGFFFWTMKDGQYDDLDGAAHRILIEEDEFDRNEQPSRHSGTAKLHSNPTTEKD